MARQLCVSNLHRDWSGWAATWALLVALKDCRRGDSPPLPILVQIVTPIESICVGIQRVAQTHEEQVDRVRNCRSASCTHSPEDRKSILVSFTYYILAYSDHSYAYNHLLHIRISFLFILRFGSTLSFAYKTRIGLITNITFFRFFGKMQPQKAAIKRNSFL